MPHRKEIRQWLLPLSARTTAYPIVLLAFDYALLLAALAGAVLVEAWWIRLLCGMAAGFVTGRLFIVGHDACHQSLTPHRRLNHWLGRIAFLPSLTPYGLGVRCGPVATAPLRRPPVLFTTGAKRRSCKSRS